MVPIDAASDCRRAVQLYRGEFLAGFYVRNAAEFEAWMLAEKDRLRETLLHCLETLAGRAVARRTTSNRRSCSPGASSRSSRGARMRSAG